MKLHYGMIALALAATAPGPLTAGGAFAKLTDSLGAAAVPAPAPAAAPGRLGDAEAMQYLPPDNDNPGFDWPAELKSIGEEEYLSIGRTAAYLKTSDAPAEQLIDGVTRCALPPSTTYKLGSAPVFTGEHIVADFAERPDYCPFSKGYLYMPHVSSTSAGGLYELPLNARAFLDTIAFAEGTRDHYNYIFSFETFTSYADHPRKKICSGGLCSTAAGRYQFLSKTWDALAKDLGLKDFTPPSQEKATMEIIRRLGAYNAVAGSSKYANFSKAMTKLNKTWASLPGSPYGQPTHSMTELWAAYKTALAARK